MGAELQEGAVFYIIRSELPELSVVLGGGGGGVDGGGGGSKVVVPPV